MECSVCGYPVPAGSLASTDAAGKVPKKVVCRSCVEREIRNVVAGAPISATRRHGKPVEIIEERY